MGEEAKQQDSKVNELTAKQQGTGGMEEENAANKAFSEFREHSVAEFFKKNRQMLGFSGRTRSLTTIVHEYVTNSLDAAEEARIAPDVYVKLELLPNEHYKVTAEDNGVGIPRKHVGKALAMMLAGTKFHRYMQQRGQQGIGASGCTMFAQITTGTPVKVMSGIGDGRAYECELSINLKTNEPVMTNFKEIFSNYRGLRVEAEFAEVKYDKSDKGVYEYLRRTAMANPHAQIIFVDPFGEKIVFPRASDKVPVKPREILPHPLGITTNDLVEMARHSKARKITSFLMSEFSRVSSAKVKELDEMLNAGKEKDGPEYVNFEKKP
ncbi:MAG: DNA topoisomerase VI subunit B, partial [Candidatus Micrarchaeota archaeon]|nr:DNA topoisomerase VI subunit B [Candidatus Micrarchaeota archaeon]